MVGVRQFDEEVVLDAVLDAFWRRGPERTTMADLARAAGIQRGSLYNAYGDKEALLRIALDRYAEAQRTALGDAFADPDPQAAMAGFLDAHLARMAAPANPPGCLMTQTALEYSDHPEIGPVVRAAFARTEEALRTVLERGRDALPAGADPAAFARFFLGVSRGMAVLHRATGEIEPARDTARVALQVLRRPEGGPR
jgi:AcrR family transcriptional regulator